MNVRWPNCLTRRSRRTQRSGERFCRFHCDLGGRGVRKINFIGWFLVSLAVGSDLDAAEMAPRILLLDAAVAGTDIIAVGERGTVLVSSDNARTWQPASSSTQATLTGVSFAADT